ncbi:hypothetical protein ACA910_019835 [Epithemia clementina (nom. ined.)]
MVEQSSECRRVGGVERTSNAPIRSVHFRPKTSSLTNFSRKTASTSASSSKDGSIIARDHRDEEVDDNEDDPIFSDSTSQITFDCSMHYSGICKYLDVSNSSSIKGGSGGGHQQQQQSDYSSSPTSPLFRSKRNGRLSIPLSPSSMSSNSILRNSSRTSNHKKGRSNHSSNQSQQQQEQQRRDRLPMAEYLFLSRQESIVSFLTHDSYLSIRSGGGYGCSGEPSVHDPNLTQEFKPLYSDGEDDDNNNDKTNNECKDDADDRNDGNKDKNESEGNYGRNCNDVEKEEEEHSVVSDRSKLQERQRKEDPQGRHAASISNSPLYDDEDSIQVENFLVNDDTEGQETEAVTPLFSTKQKKKKKYSLYSDDSDSGEDGDGHNRRAANAQKQKEQVTLQSKQQDLFRISNALRNKKALLPTLSVTTNGRSRKSTSTILKPRCSHPLGTQKEEEEEDLEDDELYYHPPHQPQPQQHSSEDHSSSSNYEGCCGTRASERSTRSRPGRRSSATGATPRKLLAQRRRQHQQA